MNLIVKLLLSCVAVALSAYFTPGVSTGDSVLTVLVVAVVLGVLNTFVKPIIKLLALPVTVLTLGLFLFVINAMMVLLASFVVEGFYVDGFVSALIFSVILSVVSWLLNKIF